MDFLNFICFVSLIAIVFYWWFFPGMLLIHKYASSSTLPFSPPVSVIICFQNEEENMDSLLEWLEKLTYPVFEVILVDDGSQDRGTTMARQWTMKNPENRKLIVIDPEYKTGKGKKFALAEGIEVSSHEILLFTDADCTPASSQWIERMVSASLIEGKEVVLGMGPIHPGKSFIQEFAAFDSFAIAMQYGSFALRKMPYMGVGRNLLYTKDWFDKTDKFEGHRDLSSGDDDLPIDHFGKEGEIAIQFHNDSAMWSNAPEDIRSWIKQKSRHLSTAFRYKRTTKLVLASFEIAGVTFFLSMVLLFCLGDAINALVYGLVYIISVWPLFFMLTQKFAGEIKPILFPMMVVVRPILYLMAWLKVKSTINEW